MTGNPKKCAATGAEVRPSLLPFDPADLVAIRVTRAQFARMIGVSRQTVSEWVRLGKVTLGPDGKIDPAVGARQVIERTAPARLRARVFKEASATAGELRERINAQQERITALLAEVAAAQETTAQSCRLDSAEGLLRVLDAIECGFDALMAARADGELMPELQQLAWTAFRGWDEADDDGSPENDPMGEELADDLLPRSDPADSRETFPNTGSDHA